MSDPHDRLEHIKIAIGTRRSGLMGKSIGEATADPLLWGGVERQLEIISEASRKIPDEWKLAYGADIDWRGIRDIGNNLRHVYQHVNVETIWNICQKNLDPLEAAIDRMIAANPTS